MREQIAAIPTKYQGVQFRSRLEARWAAMFDLLGWQWEYEPIDLNGYIPDFVLNFPTPMIVEVKPLLGGPGCWTVDAEAAISKAITSGWTREGLLVGACIVQEKFAMGYHEDNRQVNAGLMFDGREGGLGGNPFGFSSCCGGPVDVVGAFGCRRCGHHDNGPSVYSFEHVIGLWREAGNHVQWRTVS